jgi:hypothetical protein
LYIFHNFFFIYTANFKKIFKNYIEYPVIIQISLIGMLLLLYTSDYLYGFLLWITIFCFYALAAYVLIVHTYKRSRFKILLFGSIAVRFICLVFQYLCSIWYCTMGFFSALSYFQSIIIYISYSLLFIFIVYFLS